MIYLYWYLGIGAVFLAVIFISHQLTKSHADDRLSELLQAADPRRDRWWWKVDPLDAAPRIPVGHLNPAWETYKQSIQDGDQLWAFSAPWTSEWGRKEVRDGYVILRGETIGPHFLTRWVFIDKDSEQGED